MIDGPFITSDDIAKPTESPNKFDTIGWVDMGHPLQNKWQSSTASMECGTLLV